MWETKFQEKKKYLKQKKKQWSLHNSNKAISHNNSEILIILDKLARKETEKNKIKNKVFKETKNNKREHRFSCMFCNKIKNFLILVSKLI